MGYYTNYEFSIYPWNEATSQLEKEIIEKYNIDPSQEQKWYGYEKDMQSESAKYNGILFVLTGEGEEQGDVWKKAWLNGELVYSWKLEYEIPSIPKEIINLVKNK